MIRSVGTKSTFIYDITSLSSYSKLINLLEYGYSRDEDLPQLNLSLIVDKRMGIPVMYDIYPGSIVDVSTLKNTMKKVESCGVTDYTLILDRGFFSQGNLEELLGGDCSFIIPATAVLKDVKKLMSVTQRDIEDPRYLKKFNKNPIFVKPVTLTLQNLKIDGYCYYDQKREQNEKETFYTGLYDVREKLQEVKIPGWRNPAEVFKERAGPLAKYLTWKQIDDHFEIGTKKNAVTQQINGMGKSLIFYNGDYNWMDCLSLYRERDIVEKGFKSLKHDIESLPLNTNKDSTTRGFLFISFIGLILKMRLVNRMKETGLIKGYTLEKLLLELEKIKKIELRNGEIILSKVTKKCRNILDKLGLCA
jgi:Transposase